MGAKGWLLIYGFSLVFSAICSGIDHLFANIVGTSTMRAASVPLIAPFLKSCFTAFLSQKALDSDGLRKLGIALPVTFLGFLVGTLGILLRSWSAMLIVTSLGFTIAVTGYLPLMHAERRAEKVDP